MNCKNPICQADRDTMHEANDQLRAEVERLRDGADEVVGVMKELGHKEGFQPGSTDHRHAGDCINRVTDELRDTKLQISDMKKVLQAAWKFSDARDEHECIGMGMSDAEREWKDKMDEGLADLKKRGVIE